MWSALAPLVLAPASVLAVLCIAALIQWAWRQLTRSDDDT